MLRTHTVCHAAYTPAVTGYKIVLGKPSNVLLGCLLQVEGYELFSCYAPEVLRAAFSHWHWHSGFPGYFNIDDFVR